MQKLRLWIVLSLLGYAPLAFCVYTEREFQNFIDSATIDSSIELNCENYSGDQLTQLFQIKELFQNGLLLTFKNCLYETASKVADSIQILPNLKYLIVIKSDFDGTDLLKFLEKFPNLTTLYIKDTLLSDAGIILIHDTGKKFSELEYLSVRKNPISKEFIPKLKGIFPNALLFKIK